MYHLVITFSRGAEVRTHNDNVDRIWYLVQEWIKQPKTESIVVTNATNRRVFDYRRY